MTNTTTNTHQLAYNSALNRFQAMSADHTDHPALVAVPGVENGSFKELGEKARFYSKTFLPRTIGDARILFSGLREHDGVVETQAASNHYQFDAGPLTFTFVIDDDKVIVELDMVKHTAVFEFAR